MRVSRWNVRKANAHRMGTVQVADPTEAVECLEVWGAVEVASVEACLEAAWEAVAVVCRADHVVVCLRVARATRIATTMTSNRQNMTRRSRRFSPKNNMKAI